MTSRVAILNAQFDRLTQSGTVDAVFDGLAAGLKGWVCTINVATLMTMRLDAKLQSFVDRALLVVADGQPLVWSSRLFGGRLPERVAGVDLIDALCERAAAEGVAVYCLGARPALNDAALSRLRSRFPGLTVTGSDGYFAPEDAGSVADAVRASGARLLFVGMGTPRQDSFIDDHWERLGVDMAIGVGGSFDVLAGARVRAHPKIAGLGLEWLVRLVQEPIRLSPRYLATNWRFCVLIAGVVLGLARRRLAAD